MNDLYLKIALFFIDRIEYRSYANQVLMANYRRGLKRMLQYK